MAIVWMAILGYLAFGDNGEHLKEKNNEKLIGNNRKDEAVKNSGEREETKEKVEQDLGEANLKQQDELKNNAKKQEEITVSEKLQHSDQHKSQQEQKTSIQPTKPSKPTLEQRPSSKSASDPVQVTEPKQE